jgi:microcompartment protein CcmL/EutN
MAEESIKEPAALIIEFSSIAQGYSVLDQCLKSATVEILEASFLTPGKFLIFLKGPLAEVERAYQKAHELFKESIIDFAIIPVLDKRLVDALYGLSKVEAKKQGIVVVETSTLSSMLLGLYVVTTKKSIELIEIRAGRGIGGKSIAYWTGDAGDLQDALDIFERTVKGRGTWIAGHAILNPHPKFLGFFNISGEV